MVQGDWDRWLRVLEAVPVVLVHLLASERQEPSSSGLHALSMSFLQLRPAFKVKLAAGKSATLQTMRQCC